MNDPQQYVVAIGVSCIDEYYSLPQWPQEGNQSRVEFVEAVVGGMIPNAACVLAGYGVKTYLIDHMNSGPVTQKILEDLQSYRLDVSFVRFSDRLPDVKCMIFLTPGERTLLAVDGQKPDLTLDERQSELLHGAAYVYTTTYDFMKIPDFHALADSLKQHGAKLVFDVEGASFTEEEAALLKKANLLFFNQFGFAGYCAGRAAPIVLAELFGSGVDTAVVTLGKEGCRCYTKTEEIRVNGVQVAVVDPTGAGDTFNSSFLRCMLEGWPIRKSLAFATAAAAYAVTRQGPKGGVNTAGAVEQLMREYGIASIQ